MNTSSSSPIGQADFRKLKIWLTNQITPRLEEETLSPQDRQKSISTLFESVIQEAGVKISKPEKEQLLREIQDELLGYGILQPLLDDPEISEIMINGHNKIYVERKGIISKTNLSFENDEQVLRLIDRIILPLGRRIDADSPAVDARLPDGSRVNAIIPPVAIDGPSITIRKFEKGRLSIEQLIAYGTLTEEMAEFVKACVLTRLNIIICGGTGSGKTTLLNVLSSFIPENERIVTIEDAAELKLQQDHIVRLETKVANSEGKNAFNIRELVRNSLRMRPDRIIIGEVRGGEALDMLQALNTGHDGSLTTLHANSARDAVSRLETMCLMAGMELPLKVVREQIASAIDLVISIARLKDGSRRIISITEISGMEGDTVVMTDIFKYIQSGVGADGKIIAELVPTGIRPLFYPRIEAAGMKLSPKIFGANLSEMVRGKHP